jgi:hypothetical protein
MELTLIEFVNAVVIGSFLIVCIAACVSRIRALRERRRLLASRRICRICLHPWTDLSHHPTSSCPRCGAANRRKHGGLFGWNHDSALPS